MNDSGLVWFAFAVGLFLGISGANGWHARAEVIRDKALAAIAACELPLPRTQHCEYIITARVAKPKD